MDYFLVGWDTLLYTEIPVKHLVKHLFDISSWINY